MNNKTIIELGFCIIWRIMEIKKGVIHFSLRSRQITPSLISIIPHKILCLIHKLLINYYKGGKTSVSYLCLVMRYLLLNTLVTPMLC